MFMRLYMSKYYILNYLFLKNKQLNVYIKKKCHIYIYIYIHTISVKCRLRQKKMLY